MTAKYIILLAILLVGSGIYINMLVKIKDQYKIKKEKGLYRHANRLHKWLEIVIVIILLLIFYLITFIYSKQFEFYYFMGALAILYSFRTFMEWKYEAKSNRYMITTLNSSFFLFLFVILFLSSYI